MEINKIVQIGINTLAEEQASCDVIDRWVSGKELGFRISSKATHELRELADKCKLPWLGLVTDAVAQALRVSDITTNGSRNDFAWEAWTENGLAELSPEIFRKSAAYGVVYAVISRPVLGSIPKIRIASPRRVAVSFDDPSDLYPSSAVEVLSSDAKTSRYLVYTPGTTYEVEYNPSEKATNIISTTHTGLQVIPVVPISATRTLDGDFVSDVEKLIPAVGKIQKTAYDRMITQHFNSWRVKYATGLELPTKEVPVAVTASTIDDVEGLLPSWGDSASEVTETVIDKEAAQKVSMKLSQDSMLISESPDTKFGTLETTDLSPFIEAWRSDVEALAAVSQTPTHTLSGTLANVAGDAISQALSPFYSKISERKTSLAACLVRVMKVAGAVVGKELPSLSIMWDDVEAVSLSQAGDAYSKLAAELDIPARALWSKIPGVTGADVEAWEAMRQEDIARDPLASIITRNAYLQAGQEGLIDGEDG